MLSALFVSFFSHDTALLLNVKCVLKFLMNVTDGFGLVNLRRSGIEEPRLRNMRIAH